MANIELQFHKVTRLPDESKAAQFRGHIFFNDATEEPLIEYQTGSTPVKKYESGIYLCELDIDGNAAYIPYNSAGGNNENVGIDVDSITDSIKEWAQEVSENLAKYSSLSISAEGIMNTVQRLESDNDDFKDQLSQIKQLCNSITTTVRTLNNGVVQNQSKIEQTEQSINSSITSINGLITQLRLSLDGIETRVEGNENNYTTVSQRIDSISAEVSSQISDLEQSISTITIEPEVISAAVKTYTDNELVNYASLDVTDNKISTAVVDATASIQSTITQTADTIRSEITDGDYTSSIVQSINDSGSEVKIAADHIVLDGEAIANSLSVSGAGAVAALVKNDLESQLGVTFAELKQQADGAIENHYYNYFPVDVDGNLDTTVKPYSDWVSGSDTRLIHVGDTFTNISEGDEGDERIGCSWRFVYNSTLDEYGWVKLDNKSSLALTKAKEALDAAQSKRRVFTITPATPYEEGDLWVKSDSTNKKSEIYVCNTTRATGSFTSSDWESATAYALTSYVDSKNTEILNRLADDEASINNKISESDFNTLLATKGYVTDGDVETKLSGIFSKETVNGVEKVTVIVGENTYNWVTTPGVDADGKSFITIGSEYGTEDKENHNTKYFTVSTDGLLRADNAVIYGTIYASEGEFTGEVNAGSGTIGGLVIDEEGEGNGVHSDNFDTSTGKGFNLGYDGTLEVNEGKFGNLYINGNKLVAGNGGVVENANAYFDEDGVLHATGAEVSGTITATSLTISDGDGGVTDISDAVKLASFVKDNIEPGTTEGSFDSTVIDGGLVLTGNILTANSNNEITAGVLGATDVEEEVSTLADVVLEDADVVEESVPTTSPDTTGRVRFFAGSEIDTTIENIDIQEEAAKAPFVVYEDGKLHASNAEITGEINATSGTIGGINISDNGINADSFSLTNDGLLKANNANITGKINATSLTAELNTTAEEGYERKTIIDADEITVQAESTTADGPVISNITLTVMDMPDDDTTLGSWKGKKQVPTLVMTYNGEKYYLTPDSWKAVVGGTTRIIARSLAKSGTYKVVASGDVYDAFNSMISQLQSGSIDNDLWTAVNTYFCNTTSKNTGLVPASEFSDMITLYNLVKGKDYDSNDDSSIDEYLNRTYQEDPLSDNTDGVITSDNLNVSNLSKIESKSYIKSSNLTIGKLNTGIGETLDDKSDIDDDNLCKDNVDFVGIYGNDGLLSDNEKLLSTSTSTYSRIIYDFTSISGTSQTILITRYIFKYSDLNNNIKQLIGLSAQLDSGTKYYYKVQ